MGEAAAAAGGSGVRLPPRASGFLEILLLLASGRLLVRCRLGSPRVACRCLALAQPRRLVRCQVERSDIVLAVTAALLGLLLLGERGIALLGRRLGGPRLP